MDTPSSCYGSMVASTSAGYASDKIFSSLDQSSNQADFVEAPSFFYDMDNDLRDLKLLDLLGNSNIPQLTADSSQLCNEETALKGAEFLQDSGYQSVLERSQHPFSTSLVVTDDTSDTDESTDDTWDGYLTVGIDRVRIKDMSDILASRYAFLSGQCLIHFLISVVYSKKCFRPPVSGITLYFKVTNEYPALSHIHFDGLNFSAFLIDLCFTVIFWLC
uniref:NAC domain-containing protein n=1 Tax=Heterorhabditis bacteriophora TaxID=37862 RepID=A0A1I7X000_HETBA